MPKEVVIVQNAEKEVPYEVLAESIAQISKFGRAINASRLSRRAISLLINDSCGVPKRDIDAVLDALPELEKRYLKQK